MSTNRSALSRSRVLALAFLALAACKGDPDDSDTGDGPTPTTPPGLCEVVEGPLTEDLEVEDCLDVVGRVDVGAALRLGAGAEVRVAQGGALVIGPNGSIQANGTAEAPVRIVGVVAQAGSWQGLSVASTDPQNRLTFTEVRHAGAGPATVSLEAGAVLALEDVTLAEGAADGLRAGAAADLDVDGLTVTSHAGPIATVGFEHLGAFGGSFDGGSNAAPRIDVRGGAVEVDLVVAAADVPFRVLETVDVYAELDVGVGVVFEMEQDTAVWFAPESGVRLLGSSPEPIVFRGVEGGGSWRGVVLASSDPSNVFDTVDIEDAGSATYFSAREASLAVQTGARGLMANLVLRDSDALCVDVEAGAAVVFADNLYDGCPDGSLSVAAEALAAVDGVSQYDTPVHVRGGILEEDVTLAALNVPYEVDGTVDVYDAVVTFNPGADLAFAADTALWFDVGAGLRMLGEAGQPVVLRSQSGLPAGWRGLVIASADPANRIEHAELREGGSASYFCADAANLCVTNLGAVTLDSVLIADSDAWGLYAEDAASVSLLDVTYTGNATDERLPPAP